MWSCRSGPRRLLNVNPNTDWERSEKHLVSFNGGNGNQICDYGLYNTCAQSSAHLMIGIIPSSVVSDAPVSECDQIYWDTVQWGQVMMFGDVVWLVSSSPSQFITKVWGGSERHEGERQTCSSREAEVLNLKTLSGDKRNILVKPLYVIKAYTSIDSGSDYLNA